MIESKNFKSRQVYLQLYRFKESINKYIRIETMCHIMGEDTTVKEMFERIAIKRNKKDKIFILTIKNLEGVDMDFYLIQTNVDGITRRITELTPDKIITK